MHRDEHLYHVIPLGEEIFRLIEDAMSQTTTYQYTEEDVEKQWGELLIRKPLLLVELAHEQIAQQQTNHPAGGVVAGYEGLASHGGVFGMFVGIWLYCRNMKVSGWVVLDNMGICSGITATFIRLGNLMNSEIIGKVTDVPWAFIFVREDQYPRHPGQLYEALAYFCFFLLILFIYKKRGPKSVGTGFYFGLCLTLIFTFRFFIEYTKEIQVAFEAGLPMDMGQILSIPLIIAGVWSIASSTKRAKEKNVETK